MTEPQKLAITAPDSVDMALVLGPHDANLDAIRNAFKARITVRGNEVKIKGDPVETKAVGSLFDDLVKMVEQGGAPDVPYVTHAIELLHTGAYALLRTAQRRDFGAPRQEPPCGPRRPGSLRRRDPLPYDHLRHRAGRHGQDLSGHGRALAALKRKEVGRIVLSRPVVEAGSLPGFLPGTLDRRSTPTSARSTTPSSRCANATGPCR